MSLSRSSLDDPPVDREQLRRDLSDALKAIQRADDVTGLDVLAATLEERPYAFHGRLMQKSLSVAPPGYSALIWSLVQVISKLEKDSTG